MPSLPKIHHQKKINQHKKALINHKKKQQSRHFKPTVDSNIRRLKALKNQEQRRKAIRSSIHHDRRMMMPTTQPVSTPVPVVVPQEEPQVVAPPPVLPPVLVCEVETVTDDDNENLLPFGASLHPTNGQCWMEPIVVVVE